MPHPFDTVKLENGARLLLTPCPGTKEESLEQSIATLKAAGAEAVITLMLPEEQEKYGVSHLQSVTAEADLAWYSLPIPDDEQPEAPFENNWAKYKKTLVQGLNEGKTYAVHCKGGQGRTSLVSALLMLEMGMDWPEVKATIQAVKPRGLTIQKHLDYIDRVLTQHQ